MDLYTRLVSSIVFPLHERLKGHRTADKLKALERTQWASAGEIAAAQVAQLREFLTDAGRHVPYYEKTFAKAGFEPRALQGVHDLQRVPRLTKSIVRAQSTKLVRPGVNGLSKSSTGGSSGEPLIFLVGKDRVSHDVAARWRGMRWWNVDVGDPEVVLWGSPIELGAQDRIRLMRDWLLRSQLVSAFDMSEENLDRYLCVIRSVRPRRLFGYPYSMAHLARHAEQRGIAMNDLGIKVVFVTSEQLFEDQRETISRVFGCPVANEYGGRDAGLIAQECPEGGMHINAEDVIVEILDAEGRQLPVGQPGEVTITHLATWDFPFIRYRTGDIAVLDDKPCRCGRALPLIREIQGRSNDFLKSLSGTSIPCGAFTYLLRGVPGIESYKVVQESLLHTRILIQAGDGFRPASLTGVVTGFQRRLGEQVRIDIEYVAHIPKEDSGKFRYITSRVS